MNQSKILDLQDKELYKLHETVKKNLRLSKMVYNEVINQEDIINNLDYKVDNTTQNIKSKEFKTQKIIIQDENTCCNIL